MLSTRPSCADQDGTGSPSRFVPSITSAEPCGHKLVRAIAYRQHSSRFGSIDKTKREDPISPAHKRSDPQDPAADTPGAARPPGRQRADRIRPADPLTNHCCRHPRKGPQQLTDPRLELIHNRSAQPPPIRRRPIASQRRLHREQPIKRAISEIDTPSDRRSRRISAQSSTINTCFLPGSTAARVTGKLVKPQPHRGQYSVAVDR
jgi:hypothetical protein